MLSSGLLARCPRVVFVRRAVGVHMETGAPRFLFQVTSRAMPIRIREIDHIVLRVVDIDRMLDFYCAVLGCEVERRVDEIGLIQLRAGRSLVDLVPVDSKLGTPGWGCARCRRTQPRPSLFSHRGLRRVGAGRSSRESWCAAGDGQLTLWRRRTRSVDVHRGPGRKHGRVERPTRLARFVPIERVNPSRVARRPLFFKAVIELDKVVTSRAGIRELYGDVVLRMLDYRTRLTRIVFPSLSICIL